MTDAKTRHYVRLRDVRADMRRLPKASGEDDLVEALGELVRDDDVLMLRAQAEIERLKNLLAEQGLRIMPP
jgi:hypothetical protein